MRNALQISLITITWTDDQWIFLQEIPGAILSWTVLPNTTPVSFFLFPSPSLGTAPKSSGTNASIDLVIRLQTLTWLPNPNFRINQYGSQLFSVWCILSFLEGGVMKSFLTDVTGSSSWNYRNQLWGHGSKETRQYSTKEHYLIEKAELSLHLWISINSFILSK